MSELPVLFFADAAAWEAWLEENHASSPGVLLRMAKKSVADPSVRYPEAVEVALCFGWIDGQANSLGPTHWTVRFTPRRPRSLWSLVNRNKVLALMEQGRMRPAGLREVERAQADGRWEAAYTTVRETEVPADLLEALDANPAARKTFESLNKSTRGIVLDHIAAAKRPETRQKRIAQFVERFAAGMRTLS